MHIILLNLYNNPIELLSGSVTNLQMRKQLWNDVQIMQLMVVELIHMKIYVVINTPLGWEISTFPPFPIPYSWYHGKETCWAAARYIILKFP